MCLAVYIASDRELPLLPWNDEKWAFWVGELVEDDAAVRGQFSLPNVRYVGSDAGCGCGFFKPAHNDQELPEAERNYSDLAAYLTPLIATSASIELFACWQGDQDAEKQATETITLGELTTKEFEFQEKYFYRITGAP